MNPIWLAVMLFVCGAGFVVAGVHVLAGPGWSLLTAGFAFFVVCFIIVRGVNGRGG